MSAPAGSAVERLRSAGIPMGGAFRAQTFVSRDANGNPSEERTQLRIGWTTDPAKAEAARIIGATVTHHKGATEAFDGWEISFREVVT